MYSIMSQRSRVISLYRKLQYLGREYPGSNGPDSFRRKCHNIFMRHSLETNPQTIQNLLDRGEYVVKELQALYSLRKYRAMKKRYYDTEK